LKYHFLVLTYPIHVGRWYFSNFKNCDNQLLLDKYFFFQMKWFWIRMVFQICKHCYFFFLNILQSPNFHLIFNYHFKKVLVSVQKTLYINNYMKLLWIWVVFQICNKYLFFSKLFTITISKFSFNFQLKKSIGERPENIIYKQENWFQSFILFQPWLIFFGKEIFVQVFCTVQERGGDFTFVDFSFLFNLSWYSSRLLPVKFIPLWCFNLHVTHSI